MPEEPLLSVRDLRTEFVTEDAVIRAVDGLSYDLEAGRTLAVVGESGSGKSVHALSILGLLPMPPARIVSGEIIFNGFDLLQLSPERLRKLRGEHIAMIFQEPMSSLNPVMPIGKQVSESLILHKGLTAQQAEKKAAELLGKVGIPSPEARCKDYPHQFSGGMRQRAMIAMGISCAPEILIADEPTTALDVTIQAQILELMKHLQAESQMALILITHNIGVVAEMADDVVVMYAGRAVEKAPVDRIFREPRHPYTRALLESVPSIFEAKDRLASIKGHPPDLAEIGMGCAFAPRCPEVLDRCLTQSPPPHLFSPTHETRCWLAEKPAEKSA